MRSSYRQPSLGEGFVSGIAVDRVLSQTAYLRRSLSALFHTAFPSNLRPFGAPPSIGRRECLRKPLPLEGAAERSEAGLASFLGGLRRFPSLFFIPLVPYPARSTRHLPHAGKALSVDIVFSTYAYIRSDNARKAAFSYRSLVFSSLRANMYPHRLSISPRNPRA